MALDCLETLVGLSDRNCPCFTTGRPDGETEGVPAYNTSTTGYFLTDHEYGFPLKDAIFANIDCGQSSIWDVLTESRTKAIRDFKTDLLVALGGIRRSNVINWNGAIGKYDADRMHLSHSGTVGMQLRPTNRLKHATFVVTAIWVGLNTSGSFNLTVGSNNLNYTGQTVALTSVAGKFNRNALTTAIALPLYDTVQYDLKYNFTMQPGGTKPLDNQIWCCSKPVWMNHIAVGGINTQTLIEDNEYGASSGYGLSLEGYFDCQKLDWICELDQLNSYELKQLVGRTIQMGGAIKLMSAVLDSGKVNAYTLLETEKILGKRKQMRTWYNNNITYLAENLPANASSCWGCDKDAWEVSPNFR